MLTRRQRWWIGGIALLALVVGFIAFSFGGGEKVPFHKGKSLQEWFDSPSGPGMYSGDDSNVMAVVAIGSDAVPFLMRELCVSDARLAELPRKLWSKLGLVRREYIPADRRRMKAYFCLLHLGTNADSALPQLIMIAQDESHQSLGLAMGLLGFSRSSPTMVIPELQKLITDPRSRAFAPAITALSLQGTNARPALPRLQEIERATNIFVGFRIEAAIARVLIDATDRQSLDFIVEQWDNTNVSREVIVQTLKLLGTNATPALPAMRKMVQTETDNYHRYSLSNAIRLLETASGMEPSGPR